MKLLNRRHRAEDWPEKSRGIARASALCQQFTQILPTDDTSAPPWMQNFLSELVRMLVCADAVRMEKEFREQEERTRVMRERLEAERRK